MIEKYKTKQLKLNAPLRGLPAGHIQRIRIKDGVPVDRYWRRRLKDAKIDGCVEIVPNKPVKPKTNKADEKIKNKPEV